MATITNLSDHPNFKPSEPEPKKEKKNRKPKGWRKDGRIKRTFTDGVRPDGKPNVLYFYGQTVEEAERERDAYKQKIKMGIDVSREKLIASDWLDELYLAYKSHLGDKAKAVMESHMRRVKSHIGEMHVVDIRNIHLQAILNRMAGMSTSTVDDASFACAAANTGRRRTSIIPAQIILCI